MDRLFEKDLTLKVLSICLALLLWLQAAAFTGPVLPQAVRDVPVQFRNLGPGLVVLTPQPTITLLVRGRGDSVRHVGKESFTAYIDLLGADLGEGSFQVYVEAPEGLSIAQVTPAEVEVDIDAWDNRQVPVSIWTLGSPATNYAMKVQQTRPTDLYVEGPRSKVQIVARVVATVDIAGATADVARAIVVKPVNADGAEVTGVTVTPSAVDVAISIVRLPPEREAIVRANVQGRPAAGYAQDSIVIEPSTVRVWAAGTAAGDLRYLWTHPIEIEGLSQTVSRDVLLLVPDGVERLEPTVVRVTVNISEAQEEREFKDMIVVPKGVASGFKVALQPATVDVVVRGPRSLVLALDPDDVLVSLDLSERGVGTYLDWASVSLPEGLVAQSITPAQIRVVVEPE